MKLLIEHKAETDLCVAGKVTPLLMASRHGNIKITRTLLNAGSNVNQIGPTGVTALYTACERADVEMVELLLTHGANPNTQQAGIPQHVMQQVSTNVNEEKIATALEGEGNTDRYGDWHGNTLQAACILEIKSIVQMLILYGADVNSSVGNSSSPLVTVCLEGRFEIAKLLIEAGADLCATNLIGHSALLMTTCNYNSQLELFDYLISQGADPLQEDRRGCNVLHYAARANKSNFIRRILDLGVNVNATDHNGWSPLHWALASTTDSTEIVSLLLQSGCDESLSDKQCRTAEDLAKTFSRSNESAILGDIARARIDSSTTPDDEGVVDLACDGCEIVSKSQTIPSM